MTLIKWLNDEQTSAKEILQVKIPESIPDVEINEDIVYDEIDRGVYCPKCNMLVIGLPCGMDYECPW